MANIQEHKCCRCGVVIDVTHNEVPPQWFGAYLSDKLTDVICLACIEQQPEGVLWI